jgi:uncharacterized protein involved in response to NO
MLNITDNAQEQKIPALFRLGFRPMFLSAGFFAALAVGVWVSVLVGVIQFSPVNGALWWHAHEMVFGFSSAVIVGFLLTAVQTWTGQAGVRGWSLFWLWAVWLAARVLLFFNFPFVPLWLVALLDNGFLLLAAVFLAIPIIKVRQYRNLFFVPVLLLLTLCNLIAYYKVNTGGIQHGVYAAIMIVTLVMTVMGGRVIPFFTANACKFEKPIPIKYLELVSLISVWLIAIGFLFNLHTNSDFRQVFALLFAIAGLTNLVRWARWKFVKTLSTPLLWSLHLSYLFIPVSFLLMSYHSAVEVGQLSTILHGLTAGAMGSMILAMMARVSLGHSGRTLQVASIIPTAFAAVILAGVVRVGGGLLLTDWYLQSVLISAVLWCYGFIVFSLVYWPVLTKPRVDGRPG